MNRVKNVLFSEKGMQAVSVLFVLALLFRGIGIIYIAYAAWIAHLTYCMRRSPSKGMALFYKILIAFAAAMICLNLYFMVRSMG